MKQFLALFRAGRSSLHPEMTRRLEQQSFDYALSWFGEDDPADLGMADGAVFVHRVSGAKWPGLAETLKEHWEIIQRYDYVWLPDDDLRCTPENVSELFAICADLGVDLAQPALTAESYFSHVVSMAHTGFQVRFTNFVEVMAPVLSRAMLARVQPTLHGAISGWGLDNVWPRMTTVGKVAVIDATPVTHTRPIGGPNYAASRAAGISAEDEARLTLARHAVSTPSDVQLVYGGLLASGDGVCTGATAAEVNRLLGHLMSSVAHLRLSPLALTQYLGHQVAFWQEGGVEGRPFGAQGYPRDRIRTVLTEALAHAGITFPEPSTPS